MRKYNVCLPKQIYLKEPKHSIKLTDPTPFKECYRCIPPGMHDEVKTHIKEMLDVGAI